jgi:hypothetical protein
MKGYFVICCLLLQFVGFSQPTRREIIGNKIMSVESTVYNRAGTKMNVQKNYYSAKGSDSLELDNGEPGFSYKEAHDDKGRVKSLTRYDQKGKDDELHIYEYNDTGYTIEVIAHGAGTIDFSVYNWKHDCIEKIISSTDTFYFSINELGKIGKVAQSVSGRISDIAVTEFDAKGFPVVIRPLDDSPYIQRFVYNEQGLPIEQRRLKMNNSQEQLVLKIVYAYEFRQN